MSAGRASPAMARSAGLAVPLPVPAPEPGAGAVAAAATGAPDRHGDRVPICSPLDLKVQFLRPAWPDGRELRATADVGHHGHRFATAGARVVDDHGAVVALATSSFVIVAGKTWGSLTVADDTPAHEGAGLPSPIQ